MPELERKLGLGDSVFLVIGSVLGSGIFLTTGIIAKDLPSPFFIWLAWLVGGLLAMSGALTYGELGALWPKAGGPYVYLKESYGSLAAFLYGWAFFWVIGGGGIAALAVGFAEYLGSFVPGLSLSHPFLELDIGPLHIHPSFGQIIAVLSIVLLSGMNYFGIRSGARLQNVFAIIRIVTLLGLAGFGLAIGKKSGIHALSEAFRGSSEATWSGFALALIPVVWTYDGWYSVSCTAEEVKRPGRNIPLGLALGTLSVTLLYLLTNIVYSIALPMEKMKGIVRVGEAVSLQLFGPKGGAFLTAMILLAIFGCLSATVIYCPRIPFAMARDRLFFRNMAFVHPRYHVPSKAITAQMIWSGLLCLSGTYQSLYEYVVFALALFFAATGFSVIILRLKDPGRPRPYRVWGYPVLPLLFVLANLALFMNMVFSRPLQSLAGSLLLVLGVPAYIFWKKTSLREDNSGRP
jgi:APA family basic amino acid/polyamine antiporter